MKKLALAAVAALVAFPAFADQQRDSVAKNLIAMGNIIDVFGYACNLSDGDREAADIAVSATAEQFNIDLNWLANEIRKRNSEFFRQSFRLCRIARENCDLSARLFERVNASPRRAACAEDGNARVFQIAVGI